MLKSSLATASVILAAVALVRAQPPAAVARDVREFLLGDGRSSQR